MPRPIDTISVPSGKGTHINAAIWENEVVNDTQRYTTYSVTLEKRYRDGESWKTAKSFQTHELLHVAFVAGEAYKRILLARQEGDHQDVA